MNIRKVIETTANLAIIGVSLMLCWVLAVHKLRPEKPSGIEEQHSILAGDRIDELPDHPWKQHEQTLVLALRKGCRYCEASLPFYKQLSDLQQSGKLRPHVLAVTPDAEAATRELLPAAGVKVESISDEPLDKLNVRATPTLMLLDSSGHVLKSWVGLLDESGQKEVLAAIIR